MFRGPWLPVVVHVPLFFLRGRHGSRGGRILLRWRPLPYFRPRKGGRGCRHGEVGSTRIHLGSFRKSRTLDFVVPHPHLGLPFGLILLQQVFLHVTHQHTSTQQSTNPKPLDQTPIQSLLRYFCLSLCYRRSPTRVIPSPVKKKFSGTISFTSPVYSLFSIPDQFFLEDLFSLCLFLPRILRR